MLKTITDIEWADKTALVRVDFNVPMTDTGQVADDTRIRASLPTIRYLLEHGAKVVLMSHLGRPKGMRLAELSLRPVATRLAQLLDAPVAFAEDAVGPLAQQAVAGAAAGSVVLLENLRFHADEEANRSAFAKRLAKLGDVFVNDAFGTAHRAHASTVGVARLLPAVAGFLLERELEVLNRLRDPERPFVVVVGGAKISDKLGVLNQLLDKADRILVGGGMANTLLSALGYDMQHSLVEEPMIPRAQRLIAASRERNLDLELPLDVVAAEFFVQDAPGKVCKVDQIPAGWVALDIGPMTVERFTRAMEDARTIFWNGPMGVAEWPSFAKGTEGVARAVAESSAFTVVGGGDSVAALEQAGLVDRISHVSTGGGASLEFLEGRELPGVAALEQV